MTNETKKERLIDKAVQLGIGKRTLQSWGELGCPTNGTVDAIRHWRETTTALESPRRGRPDYGDAIYMQFSRLNAVIDRELERIGCSDRGGPETVEQYDLLDDALRDFISVLWSHLSRNYNDNNDRQSRFDKWFAHALDGCDAEAKAA